MFPTPIQKKPLIAQISYQVGVVLMLMIWLAPLFAMMMTSMRSLHDLHHGNYWSLPTEWLLVENYVAVFTLTKMGQFMWNSVMITVLAVVGVLMISSLAAYSLAKYRFRLNLPIFAMFIAGNFIPYQILMIPVRNLTIELGLYDTILGLVLFHVAFQAGFCTLFLRNFIKALPDSLIEAARIDGASEIRIFFSVIVPLIRPALAALAVLMFTFIWNDYFWALVLVQSDSVRPVTAGLESLKGGWTLFWNFIAAGSILAAMPPVLMFFLMQKHLIAGLTLGAVKG